MPEFTPTNKMLQLHADKGSEDWEIYAECVRDAMSKHSGFATNNQPIREKFPYDDLMIGKKKSIVVNGKLFYFKEDAEQVLAS